MEGRFTFKDLLVLGLLVVLAILLFLAMYMVDRQWIKMSEIEHTMDEQARDLRDLRGLVSSIEQRIRTGSIASSVETVPPSTDGFPPAFRRAATATEKLDYHAGDWLVQAFSVGLKTLTPFVSSDAYASEIQSYVFESLLVRHPETLEWEGLIARDWNVSDDGLTFTFQLRKDVTFSDGEPLDAQDVVFTFGFIMNERIDAPRQRAYLNKIDSVTSTKPYEVVFRFKESYFNALQLAGTLPILPEHFYGPYQKEPQLFNQSKGLLLGSGPYRLADPKGWTPDQGLVELERNPRYWGPIMPTFDRLLWKVIENDSARLTTFRNGDLDVYLARPLEYQALLNDDELTARTQHFEYMSPTAGYSYVAWNQRRNGKPTRFADVRVRKAMTYLTDRRRIIEDIWLGYAQPAVSPFNPISPQHDPDLVPRQYNLQEARRLLTEAGYADRNEDGILEDVEGNPFRFELAFFQDNSDTQRTVLFLKDLYARAGILLEPRPTEWSVMLDLLTHRDFDAITLGWTSGVEVDIFQMFHSSQIDSGGDNFIFYENTRLDALIEKARGTVEEDERMPLWRQCENILYQDQPYTFLMRRKTLAFIDSRIRNLEITRLGLNLTAVPIEIYVPAKLQRYSR